MTAGRGSSTATGLLIPPMNPSASALDPTQCPLCGRSNQCPLCAAAPSAGPCWCASVEFPEALLACVPPNLRNRACVCESCVREFHRAHLRSRTELEQPGDFNLDANGLLAFTEGYLKRLGYCCGSGCRHCPYPE